MKNINKKGQFEDFMSLIITIIILVILLAIVILFLRYKMEEKQNLISNDLNKYYGFFTTRVALNYEYEDGSKLYDKIIYATNNNDLENLKIEIIKALQKFYPGGVMDKSWLIIINEDCFILSNKGQESTKATVNVAPATAMAPSIPIFMTFDACEEGTIDQMPKVTIPNPDGYNILVLMKPVNTFDSKIGRVFGYRAEQLKGQQITKDYGLTGDGANLDKIINIDNVACTGTCLARADLVAQLRKLSEEKLKKENIQLTISDSYRTNDQQYKTWMKWCNGKSCGWACNPNGKVPCPHVQGGAIDISVSVNGKPLNLEMNEDFTPKNPTDVAFAENLMCDFEFVRYCKEGWHYEYGTYWWDIINKVRQKQNTKIPCNFGTCTK